MKRYIDVDSIPFYLHKGWDLFIADKQDIDKIPSADVVEVKHGEWIDLNITEWQCSECNYRVERWNNTPYCPECGAKMDGKNDRCPSVPNDYSFEVGV